MNFWVLSFYRGTSNQCGLLVHRKGEGGGGPGVGTLGGGNMTLEHDPRENQSIHKSQLLTYLYGLVLK